MDKCLGCKYAIFDYEEYYGGYRERIVVGCKKDQDPDGQCDFNNEPEEED